MAITYNPQTGQYGPSAPDPSAPGTGGGVGPFFGNLFSPQYGGASAGAGYNQPGQPGYGGDPGLRSVHDDTFKAADKAAAEAHAASMGGPAPNMQDLYTAMGMFGKMIQGNRGTEGGVRAPAPISVGGSGHANPYLARALAPPDVQRTQVGGLGQYLGRGG